MGPRLEKKKNHDLHQKGLGSRGGKIQEKKKHGKIKLNKDSNFLLVKFKNGKFILEG